MQVAIVLLMAYGVLMCRIFYWLGVNFHDEINCECFYVFIKRVRQHLCSIGIWLFNTFNSIDNDQ